VKTRSTMTEDSSEAASLAGGSSTESFLIGDSSTGSSLTGSFSTMPSIFRDFLALGSSSKPKMTRRDFLPSESTAIRRLLQTNCRSSTRAERL